MELTSALCLMLTLHRAIAPRAFRICSKRILFTTFGIVACAATSFAEDLVAIPGARSPAATHVNRGVIAYVKGDLAGARPHFDEAIRLEPKMWEAYYNRANIFLKQEKWELVLQDLNAAMRLQPKFLNIALLRSSANLGLGRYRETLAELNHLARNIRLTEQTSARVHNLRAWLRATCPDGSFRNGQLAVGDATIACKLSHWKGPNYIDTLAAAYAQAGDFDSAVSYQEKAIAIGEPPEGMKELRQHLDQFKQHRPIREGR
jgi:tetratricopeptide (TPR) repeat protein